LPHDLPNIPTVGSATSALTQSVNLLSKKLNELPASLIPQWASKPTDRNLRQAAADVPAWMDQRNAPGSAVLLMMLLPKVFSTMPETEAVPLRIFGHPPDNLVEFDGNARSGSGADNRRGNVMEALSVHFLNLRTHSSPYVAELAGEMLTLLQETWTIAKINADRVALLLGIKGGYSAVDVVIRMQLVPSVLCPN